MAHTTSYVLRGTSLVVGGSLMEK